MQSHDEIRYRILKALQENPELSQRELAAVLGVSLGKANYCLRAIIERGWVKVKNFHNSDNKLGYAYFLTPAGVEAKTRVALRFFKHKVDEYEALTKEIETLRQEVDAQGEGHTDQVRQMKRDKRS